MTTKKPQQGRPVQGGIALSTQLSVLLLLLAVITFFATVVVSANHMRSYLDTQLSITASDTANSLGLSISDYISGDDQVIADTMISAIFDSGNYLTIHFTTSDGKVLFERKNPVQVQGVPAWFIDWFVLKPPVMTSEVNDGWRIAGVLSVQSHPGHAYRSLWSHVKAVFWASLFICLVALAAVQLLLLAVLNPLKDIERQASQLAEKRFEVLDYLPLTKELRAVVYALNHMVSNVKRSFSELTERAEQLNQQAYLDPLTALPNRRALAQSFASLQAEADDDGDLYVALVALPSLKALNDNQGYASGDGYVQKASTLLQGQVKHLQWSQLFRISGSEFAILARLGQVSAEEFAAQLQQAFEIACSDTYPHGFANLVMMKVQPMADLSTVLSRLDAQQANLAQGQPQVLAFTDPANTVSTVTPSEQQAHAHTHTHAQPQPQAVHTRAEWQEILHRFTRSLVSDTAAGDNNTELSISDEMEQLFDLVLQPVYQDSQVLYIETFIKFNAQGQPLASSDVFAMAERLGVSLLLDKALVTYILTKLKHHKNQTFAINLSKSALHDKHFVRWLTQTLRANQAQLPPLVFEVSEHAILGAVNSANEFFNAVKQVGAQVAIERFGASFSSFRYLQGLNIDYIKIDGSYIRELKQPETRFFVQTMTHICHGIGIKVIAPQIEDVEIVAICHEIYIDAVQGRGLTPPIAFVKISQKNDCIFDINQVESLKS